MEIGVIVQARMGSNRLPGKVFKKLGGVPSLWHTFQRIKRVQVINKIILATTDLKRDDCLVDFAQDEKILIFRGNEEDVLERYYLAAKSHHLDVIVRISGDCPFIDSNITSRVIKTFIDNKVDYASTTIDKTFPIGTETEVFSFSALERAYTQSELAEDREHVTPYIYKHPNIFHLKGIKNDRNLSYIRYCVDYERDFLFVKALWHHLACDNIFFSADDIKRLTDRLPWLLEINKGV